MHESAHARTGLVPYIHLVHASVRTWTSVNLAVRTPLYIWVRPLTSANVPEPTRPVHVCELRWTSVNMSVPARFCVYALYTCVDAPR